MNNKQIPIKIMQTGQNQKAEQSYSNSQEIIQEINGYEWSNWWNQGYKKNIRKVTNSTNNHIVFLMFNNISFVLFIAQFHICIQPV